MDDYKTHSLQQLENWLHDAISAGEATPEEVYNTIKKVVEEEYYTYKNHTSRCYELLALLNGNGKGHIEEYDAVMREKEYYEPSVYSKEVPVPLFINKNGDMYAPDTLVKKDKVVKWQLPVEVDGLSGECYINLPDDLLEAANLKEGDTLEWIDNKNGSFKVKKVDNCSWVDGNKLAKTKTYDEMIAEGWSMTDDGFWIKEN